MGRLVYNLIQFKDVKCELEHVNAAGPEVLVEIA